MPDESDVTEEVACDRINRYLPTRFPTSPFSRQAVILMKLSDTLE